MSETASAVDWPPNFEHRSPQERSRNRNFDVTLARAFDDLEAELERVGVDDFRYSFDAEARKTDSRPYARANPDDPSFVLRWTMDGKQYAVGCDAYSRLRDNVRTVGLYVREKRKMESRPVATGESEFANARLPPGDDEAESVVVAEPAPDPHEVLGVTEDAEEAVVKAAARRLKADRHPDSGGSTEEFQRVVKAEEALLDG
ncbi:DnaJ domain-containing protein [Halorarum salinum]|uniref:J domain-containing protein n=1 Tax=Halorarum salinum TaxID=2743089 RepID=A0A7D5QCH2_9EURY|nr:DnaJ domain-containing protein [Halobaculum salinum]QLG63059.1 J domain-containing protein [Halobaculum salinum]